MYYKEGNKIDESTGADVNALKVSSPYSSLR